MSVFAVMAALLSSPSARALQNGWPTQDPRFADIGTLITLVPGNKEVTLNTCVGTRLSRHAVLTAAHCMSTLSSLSTAKMYFLTDAFLQRWRNSQDASPANALLDLILFKTMTNPMDAFRVGSEFAEVQGVRLDPYLKPNEFPRTYQQRTLDDWRGTLFDLAVVEIQTPTEKIAVANSGDPAWQPVRALLQNSFQAPHFEIPGLSFREAGWVVHLVSYARTKQLPAQKTFALLRFDQHLKGVPHWIEAMGLFGLENVPAFPNQSNEPGDSGAPVFQAVNGKYDLIGVHPGNIEPGDSPYFISTAPYVEWIQSQIQAIEKKY